MLAAPPTAWGPVAVLLWALAAQSAPKPPKPPPLPQLPPQDDRPAEPPEPLDPDSGRGLLGLVPTPGLGGDAQPVEHPRILWSVYLGGEPAAPPVRSGRGWAVALTAGELVWLDAARGALGPRVRLGGRPVGECAAWGDDVFVALHDGSIRQVRPGEPPREVMRLTARPVAGPTVTSGWVFCPTVSGWEGVDRTSGRRVRAAAATRSGLPLAWGGDRLVAAEWGGLAAYSLPEGRRIWAAPLPAAPTSGPLAHGDLGLVFAGTELGGVDALSLEDGALAWRASGSSAVVGIRVREGRALVAHRFGGLDLVDPTSGKPLRVRDLGATLAGPPVGVNGERGHWAQSLADGTIAFLDEDLVVVERVPLGAPPRVNLSSGGGFVLAAVGRSLLYGVEVP